MTFEVYLDPCTINCRKVLAGLDLMGIPFHLNHIDYFTGGHKAPEYVKINPCATVPAATDNDGPAITESNAILMYAGDLDGGSAAYPKDAHIRAQVNRWLLWEASVWFPSCYAYLVQNVVQPLLKSEPDQAILDAQAPNFHKLAAVLDNQLAKTKFLACDEVTIADIAVASPMHLHREQKLPLDKYPRLKKWMEEGIETLPCWQKTQGAVEKALLPNKAANGALHSQDQPASAAASSSSSSTRAVLNFTQNVNPKLTELYFYESPAAKDIHEPGDDPHEVTIHNGWPRAKEVSIDKEGFALRPFKTAYTEWEDADAMKDQFYPEVVEFLKETVGAKRVVVFDHTIRTKANDAKKLTQETDTSQRAPVMLVHCDYTAESGPMRVRQLFPDEADDLLSRRVAFINVWKPVRSIVEERPLTMCDVTSSPPDDFFKLHLRYRDRNGENYVMGHSDGQRWYYFPRMSPDEVILLKTFDSETDGRARFVGHSAFDDPDTPANAATRESIEIRTIAFF